jgi:hypothetical protein
MDLLGDLGGIVDILVSTLGLFIFPISAKSFYIDFIEKYSSINTDNSTNVINKEHINIKAFDRLKILFNLNCCLKK